MIDIPLEHTSSATTFQDVVARQLRWLFTRRVEYPFLWLCDPLSSTLVCSLIIWPFGGWWLALMYAGFAYMVESLFYLTVRSAYMSLRWSIIRDALIPLIWLRSMFMRNVQWRGRTIYESNSRKST